MEFGSFLFFVESFLFMRRQQVSIEINQSSVCINANSGVLLPAGVFFMSGKLLFIKAIKKKMCVRSRKAWVFKNRASRLTRKLW